MPPSPKFLVIDEEIHPAGIEALRAAGTVTIVPHTMPEEQIAERIADADGVVVRKGRITARLIDAAARLKIVARHGVGVDSVDREALARRNIILTTTGSANAVSVAEFTFAMMFALARHLGPAAIDMRARQWAQTRYVGIELDGKTLGIVGFGQIGSLVARRALAFGMRVLVADPLVEAAAIEAAGATKVAYTEMLGASDFLSFHVRLTDTTRGMFGDRELERVRPGIRIVNTSRGGICDEDALLRGLDSGRIGAIAFDVFEQEPISPDNKLLDHPQAILSPHVAGQTADALRNVALTAARSLIDCVAGRTPDHIYRPDD